MHTVRIWSGWYKSRQLVPFLTAEDTSLHIKREVCISHVRSYMSHGSKTWSVRKESKLVLSRAKVRMIRWMCG